jgi:glutamate-1-semialdehyde 2,1-aminomutase
VPDERQVRDYDDARTQDVAAHTAFFHSMLAQGVYLPPSAFESWFVNAALDDGAVEHVLSALPRAARAAAEARGLPAPSADSLDAQELSP